MEKIPDTPFSRSLQIQGRVIGALLMREIITRFGRHNIGFLWLFAEPMIFTLGITALWTLAGAHHISSIPITAFAITGYSSVLVWRNSVNRCILSITPNLSLMYHRNVRVIDIFISRIILEVSGATISFMTLTLFFALTGWIEFPVDIFKIIIGWFLLIWFGSSLAIILGSLTERNDSIEKLWHPISYLMFPLSGAAFLVDWLPVNIQKLALYLPMVNGVELLREGFFGNSIHAHYDITYTSIVCLCLSFVAFSLSREAGRRVEPE
jgi:capsular polysaccharide transport system permease protein